MKQKSARTVSCSWILKSFRYFYLIYFTFVVVPSAFAVPGAPGETVVAGKTLMREDYLAGSGIVSAFIHFCDEIRRDQTPDRVLPPPFEKYFFDSIEDMRKRGLSDEYAAILIKDAKELIAQNKFTLYQWNVLFYRAVVLGDLSEIDLETRREKPLPYRASSVFDYSNREFSRTHVALFESQEKTEKLLDTLGYLRSAQTETGKPTKTSYSLKPLVDGVSCPVSVVEDDLGIVPLAFAYAAHVYPLGIAHALFYDGNYTSSRQLFWRHDADHAATALGKQREEQSLPGELGFKTYFLDEFGKPLHKPLTTMFEKLNSDEITKFQKAGALFRKERLGFLKWASTQLSASDQEKVFMAYFVTDHERYQDVNQFCAKGLKYQYEDYFDTLFTTSPIAMRRFHQVSDLNILLPEALQGDRKFLDSLKGAGQSKMPATDDIPVFVPSGGAGTFHNFKAYGQEDIVEKWAEISSYVLSSYQLMCDSWIKFKSAEVAQDLRVAAMAMDQLPAMVHNHLDVGVNSSCVGLSGSQSTIAMPVDFRATLQPSEILKGL